MCIRDRDMTVYTSKLCRSADTADLLGYGAPELLPLINPFYPDKSSSPEQTADLQEWVKQQLSQHGQPKILVTHGFNIRELTDNFISQGEFLIINVDGNAVETLMRGNVDSF